jgi:hypothetical protein
MSMMKRVRGMNPRIRIHTKMSWIRNAAKNIEKIDGILVSVCCLVIGGFSKCYINPGQSS